MLILRHTSPAGVRSQKVWVLPTRTGPSSGARCSVLCCSARFRAATGAVFPRAQSAGALLPNGQRKRISARTLRRQWQRFRAEGVQGLFRRRRQRSRQVPARPGVAAGAGRRAQEGAALPFRRGHQPDPARRVGPHHSALDAVSPFATSRRHPLEARRLSDQGPLSLDARPAERLVGG